MSPVLSSRFSIVKKPSPRERPKGRCSFSWTPSGQDDFELAYSFLSKELKEECTVEEFVGGNFPKRDRLRDDRVTLESTATVKETVFVTVRVTQFRGSGLFGASESSFEQRFALRQKEGQWRFTEYPWPFFRCGPFEPVRPTPEPSSTHTPSPVPAS